LVFAGAVVRGCAVALIIVGLARGALVYWWWRLHGTLHWPVILVGVAMLVLGIVVVWWLSQATLDTYAQLYNSVPVGVAKGSSAAITFLNQVEGAMEGFIWLGRTLAIITGVAVTACAVRIWAAFDIQNRNKEHALQYQYLPHNH
jgi:hypothetical protein